MWTDTLNKIKLLKEYDTQLIVHDARFHRYQFHSPATIRLVEEASRRLKTPLPEELVYIYLNIGNGGVGPDWGLMPVEKIYNIDPQNLLSGIDSCESEIRELLAGAKLIAVMDRYYSHKSWIVAEGKGLGEVFACPDDIDFIYHEGRSICEVYSKWLDQELSRFQRIHNQIMSGANIRDILAAGDNSTLSVARSLIGLPLMGLHENDLFSFQTDSHDRVTSKRLKFVPAKIFDFFISSYRRHAGRR